MKKKSVKFLLCAAFMTFALGLTACGSTDKEKTDAPETEEQQSEEESEEPETEEEEPEVTEEPSAAEDTADTEDATESETVGLGVFETITDYVNSDIMQSQIAEVTASLEGTGIKIDIYGEDNKLVYAYTYEDFTKDVIDVSALQSGMESQAETFKSIAKTIKSVVNEPNPVVKVIYLDANGEEVYTTEFEAAE